MLPLTTNESFYTDQLFPCSKIYKSQNHDQRKIKEASFPYH